jgi:hypothetical protein
VLTPHPPLLRRQKKKTCLGAGSGAGSGAGLGAGKTLQLADTELRCRKCRKFIPLTHRGDVGLRI